MMRTLVRHPLSPLCFFALEASVCFTAALFAGVPIPPLMLTSVNWILVVLILMWVVSDAQHRHQVPCFDFGFLAWVFLPLAVPWYCFWTRGWKGVGILTLIGILLLIPTVIAEVGWFSLYGMPQ